MKEIFLLRHIRANGAVGNEEKSGKLKSLLLSLTFVVSLLGLGFQVYNAWNQRIDSFRLAAIDKRLEVAQSAYTALITFRREQNDPEKRTANAKVLDDIVVKQGLYIDDKVRHILLRVAGAVRNADHAGKQNNSKDQSGYLEQADHESNLAVPALVQSMRLTPTPEESSDGINM